MPSDNFKKRVKTSKADCRERDINRRKDAENKNSYNNNININNNNNNNIYYDDNNDEYSTLLSHYEEEEIRKVEEETLKKTEEKKQKLRELGLTSKDLKPEQSKATKDRIIEKNRKDIIKLSESPFAVLNRKGRR
eukprot:Tbor_TRINITY_DN5696_c2_g1::TRINITY_DN5696_c2_g1_i1::g.9170::m.9170